MAIAAPFAGRLIRYLDLEELRQHLTRAYVDRGYVNSGARLADAGLREGALCYRIVEGVVSELRFTGLQRLSQSYIADRLVRTGEALNVNTLRERVQLLLADPLIERLNVQLSPGRLPGEAVLEVDVARTDSVLATVFANNYRAPAVGSAVLGLDSQLRNLTGRGDITSLMLMQGKGSHDYDMGWALPLNARSTQLALRTARGASAVVEEPLASLDVSSIVTSDEITLSHPLIDQLGQKLVVGLTRSQRRQQTRVAGEPFSFVAGEADGDVRARSWRLYQELSLRLERWAVAGRLTYIEGRNNLLREPEILDQPPASYRLWTAQLQLSTLLGDSGAELLLRGNLQHSRSRLISMEQFSVGGRYSVRGYRESQLLRDNGHALSAELKMPVLDGSQGWGRLALLPFIDIGSAANRHGPRDDLASMGLGAQWRIGACDAELFWAYRLTSRTAAPRSDLQDRGVHLAIRYRAF